MEADIDYDVNADKKPNVSTLVNMPMLAQALAPLLYLGSFSSRENGLLSEKKELRVKFDALFKTEVKNNSNAYEKLVKPVFFAITSFALFLSSAQITGLWQLFIGGVTLISFVYIVIRFFICLSEDLEKDTFGLSKFEMSVLKNKKWILEWSDELKSDNVKDKGLATLFLDRVGFNFMESLARQKVLLNYLLKACEQIKDDVATFSTYNLNSMEMSIVNYIKCVDIKNIKDNFEKAFKRDLNQDFVEGSIEKTLMPNVIEMVNVIYQYFELKIDLERKSVKCGEIPAGSGFYTNLMAEQKHIQEEKEKALKESANGVAAKSAEDVNKMIEEGNNLVMKAIATRS